MEDYTPLDRMMVDIVELGEEYIWKGIEKIKNAIERAKVKGLYYEGVRRLNKKFKGE